METVLYLAGAGATIANFINAMEKLGETKLVQKARKMYSNMKEKVSSLVKKLDEMLAEVENRINQGNEALKSGLPGQEIIGEVLPC